MFSLRFVFEIAIEYIIGSIHGMAWPGAAGGMVVLSSVSCMQHYKWMLPATAGVQAVVPVAATHEKHMGARSRRVDIQRYPHPLLLLQNSQKSSDLPNFRDGGNQRSESILMVLGTLALKFEPAIAAE